MAALTAGRNTPRLDDSLVSGPVAADTTIYAGALVARNAAGDLIEGGTATGLVGVGIAEREADNAGGAAGDATVVVIPGIARMENSAAADLIAADDIGKLCYIVDDQTVALTNGTSTRSAAGLIVGVDAVGVWVRFDEMLTRAAVAAGV